MSDSISRDALGRSVATWSIKWRWMLIPLTILFGILVSYGASNLKFAGDYRVFFGADNPDFIANENAQGTFGKPDNVAFVIIPETGDIYTEDTIRAVHKLTARP